MMSVGGTTLVAMLIIMPAAAIGKQRDQPVVASVRRGVGVCSPSRTKNPPGGKSPGIVLALRIADIDRELKIMSSLGDGIVPDCVELRKKKCGN